MSGTFLTPSERTAEAKAAFLDSLAKGASVARAARAAGVCREQPYTWRKKDADFAAAWKDAIEDGTDALEDLALEMAAKGSERLIIFLLKARRPHVYRERVLPAPGAGEAVTFKMVVGAQGEDEPDPIPLAGPIG